MSSHYEDDYPEGDEEAPLIVDEEQGSHSRGSSRARRKAKRKRRREKERRSSHDADDERKSKEVKNPYWIRMALVAVVFFVVTWILCVATLFVSVYLSMLLAVMLLIFGARVGLIAAQGLFPADIRTSSWKLSLQQAVTIGVFFGAATAIIAGYFGRELHYAENGRQLVDIDSQDTVSSEVDFGSILFQGAATPIGDFVGVGWGFFGLVPICVAPVMIDTGNRQVNYWAVGHGTCCTDVSDPNCGDWNRAVGGIKLEYTEFYPKLQDAVKHSKGRKGLLPRENAPYIIWGDPDEQFKTLKYLTYLYGGITTSLGLVFIFLRAYTYDVKG